MTLQAGMGSLLRANSGHTSLGGGASGACSALHGRRRAGSAGLQLQWT